MIYALETGVLGQRPNSKGSTMAAPATPTNMPNRQIVVKSREKLFTRHEHATGGGRGYRHEV
jgi:hypothetical protein